MKGRKPKSTQQLRLSGSWRAKTRPDEPQPPPHFPEPPAGLSVSAKKVWDTIRDRTAELCYITIVDADLLAAYCNAVVQLNRAIKQDDDPAMRNWTDRVLKLGSEFGFSPSSRTRCKAVKKDTEKVDRVGFTRTG